MRSKKINLNKIFIFAWIVLFIILVISMLITINPYKNYKKGQDLAMSNMLLATDEFDEYKNNRKELLEHMYNYFNGSSFLNSYEEVRKAKDEVEDSLKDILESKGYDEFYYASDYFLYKNFFEYYEYKINSSIVLFVIYLFICAIVLIFNILYVLNRKKEILIKDNMIVFRKLNKKTKQFMIKDITSAETTFLKGLKIKGNNIKASILLLKNSEDLKKYIMNLISNKSNYDLSMADELAKYKKLLDNGAITEEEYKKKKEKLLDL